MRYAKVMIITGIAILGSQHLQAQDQSDAGVAPTFESISDPFLDASEGGKRAPSPDTSVGSDDEFMPSYSRESFAEMKRVKKRDGRKIILEVDLSPTAIKKDYPFAGGMGVGCEVEFTKKITGFASVDFNRYTALSSNSPIFDERPYNHHQLSLDYLDHMRVTAGARYYAITRGPHAGYVGGSVGVGRWESDYTTPTSSRITVRDEETVVGTEVGYRWMPHPHFSMRVGTGLGWAIPATHQVTTDSTAANDQELAHELGELRAFQYRPMFQFSLGYVY